MDVSKLPAYVGAVSKDGGYVLIRVSAVEDGMKNIDAEGKKAANAEYTSYLAGEYLAAYLKSLRAKADITIKQELVSAKTAQ